MVDDFKDMDDKLKNIPLKPITIKKEGVKANQKVKRVEGNQ